MATRDRGERAQATAAQRACDGDPAPRPRSGAGADEPDEPGRPAAGDPEPASQPQRGGREPEGGERPRSAGLPFEVEVGYRPPS